MAAEKHVTWAEDVYNEALENSFYTLVRVESKYLKFDIHLLALIEQFCWDRLEDRNEKYCVRLCYVKACSIYLQWEISYW